MKQNNIFYFIYDGECPICCLGAETYRLKKEIGEFQTIDARTKKDHPIIKEVNNLGYDLDKGMLVKFKDQFYQGDQALHLMASLGADESIINTISNKIHKHKSLAVLFYPTLKAIRSFFLWIKGVNKMNNLAQGQSSSPIFENIFGTEKWEKLPSVFHKHYANRPYKEDTVLTTGTLNIKSAWYIRPFLKLLQSMPAQQGKNIKTDVIFSSNLENNFYKFHRVFHYPKDKTHHFISHMKPIKENEIVEIMSYGISWQATYDFDGEYVRLNHKGYSFSCFGLHIPLPVTWLIGSGNAKEWAIDDFTFGMQMDLVHPLFGQIYEYTGTFEIKEVNYK